jgi:hypothetical protein
VGAREGIKGRGRKRSAGGCRGIRGKGRSRLVVPGARLVFRSGISLRGWRMGLTRREMGLGMGMDVMMGGKGAC